MFVFNSGLFNISIENLAAFSNKFPSNQVRLGNPILLLRTLLNKAFINILFFNALINTIAYVFF